MVLLTGFGLFALVHRPGLLGACLLLNLAIVACMVYSLRRRRAARLSR